MDEAFQEAVLAAFTEERVGTGWFDVPFQVPVDVMFELAGLLRRRWRGEHNVGVGFNEQTGCVTLKLTDPEDVERIRIALSPPTLEQARRLVDQHAGAVQQIITRWGWGIQGWTVRGEGVAIVLTREPVARIGAGLSRDLPERQVTQVLGVPAQVLFADEASDLSWEAWDE